MANIVKYNLSTSPNSIQSGNFNIGVNNTVTDLSQFYTGICPINGGYTIYINKASNGPSLYAPTNDAELIQIVNNLGGNISTAPDALVWINSQSTMTVLNNNYPSIVTSGLTINLDAGAVSSYPKTGTTWTDLSGNDINSTLVNGPTFDSTNYGSIVFDGVDDVCTLPINTFTSGSPQNGTFIIKLKTPPFNNTTQLIFFRDGGSTNNLIYFYRNAAWATDTYAWLIYSNAGANVLYDVYLPNQWYEIAFTFDSQGNAKTYIDGVLRDSEVWDVGATSWNRSGNLTSLLRCSSASGSGNIQRFMYYNRALSASEIQQNYYAGLQRFIPTNGLTLSLDAQNTNLYAVSTTTAYDISGNNYNGTLTNGVLYVGNGDGSWSFDGVDDYVPISGTISLGNTFTIISWIKLSVVGGTYNVYGCVANGSDNWFGVAGSVVNFRGTELADVNNFDLNGVTTLIVGVWYQITVTVNVSTVTVYLNGVVENSVVKSFVIASWNSNGGNDIGRRGGINSNFFNGNISTIQAYNTVLTQTEITTIYNATKTRYGL